jgi:hypothetical protein
VHLQEVLFQDRELRPRIGDQRDRACYFSGGHRGRRGHFSGLDSVDLDMKDDLEPGLELTRVVAMPALALPACVAPRGWGILPAMSIPSAHAPARGQHRSSARPSPVGSSTTETINNTNKKKGGPFSRGALVRGAATAAHTKLQPQTASRRFPSNYTARSWILKSTANCGMVSHFRSRAPMGYRVAIAPSAQANLPRAGSALCSSDYSIDVLQSIMGLQSHHVRQLPSTGKQYGLALEKECKCCGDSRGTARA